MWRGVMIFALQTALLGCLAGCGDAEREADAANSYWSEGHPNDARRQMHKMSVALDRLDAWSAAGWERPRDAALGSQRLEVDDSLPALLGVLGEGLAAADQVAGRDSSIPHLSQRQEDAQLALRLLAAHLQRRDGPAASKALTRVRASCTHCHARCGR